jgi:hypothetical protein
MLANQLILYWPTGLMPVVEYQPNKCGSIIARQYGSGPGTSRPELSD